MSKVKNCHPNNCPHREECPHSADKMVRYGGPLDAPVAIIGQSPGEEEEKEGEPFVGRAGDELRSALKKAGWDDSEILFTNAVHCKPKNNATPQYNQIKFCSQNLNEILAAHPRELIIAVGNEAWSALNGTRPGGVTKRAGIIVEVEVGEDEIPALNTFHPAYVLRNQSRREEFVEHLRQARVHYKEGSIELPDIDLRIIHPDYGGLPTELLTELAINSDWITVDVETTGFLEDREQLLGIGIGFASALGAEYYLYVVVEHGIEDAPNYKKNDWENREGWKRNILDCPWSPDEWIQLYEWLQKTLQHIDGRKTIAFNSKFDARWLKRSLGIDISPIDDDPMLKAALVDSERSAALKTSAVIYLNAPRWDEQWRDENGHGLEDYMNYEKFSLGLVPLEKLAFYCGLDCYYTYKLSEELPERMTEAQKALYRHVQIPLNNNLFDVEMRGMSVDTKMMAETREDLGDEVEELEERINRCIGYSNKTLEHRSDDQIGVNTKSTPDVRFCLYDILGLDDLFLWANWVEWPSPDEMVVTDEKVYFESLYEPELAYREDGTEIDVSEDSPELINLDLHDKREVFQTDASKEKDGLEDPTWSTGVEILEYLEEQIPQHRNHLEESGTDPDQALRFIELLLEHRRLYKLLRTYIDSWMDYASVDGKLHPSYLIHGTGTGRMSSKDPNAQNSAKEMCQFVVPSKDDWLICEPDHGQLEVRVWAYYSQDPGLIEAVQATDVHSATAATAMGKDPEDITKEERDRGKIVMFGGLMYGGEAPIIMAQAGCDWETANEIFEAYQQAYPVGYQWLRGEIAFAKKHGYVESVLGRRRYIPGINSDDYKTYNYARRKAMNTNIQGTASDVTCIGVNRVVEALDNYGFEARVINTVHDSIILECPRSEMMDLYVMLQKVMTRPPWKGFNVPLTVDVDFWPRWKYQTPNLEPFSIDL